MPSASSAGPYVCHILAGQVSFTQRESEGTFFITGACRHCIWPNALSQYTWIPCIQSESSTSLVSASKVSSRGFVRGQYICKDIYLLEWLPEALRLFVLWRHPAPSAEAPSS